MKTETTEHAFKLINFIFTSRGYANKSDDWKTEELHKILNILSYEQYNKGIN